MQRHRGPGRNVGRRTRSRKGLGLPTLEARAKRGKARPWEGCSVLQVPRADRNTEHETCDPRDEARANHGAARPPGHPRGHPEGLWPERTGVFSTGE